ncbi:hypothetical protein CH063_13648 [Colletotrichum higginsianum]|uniref:Uncharacterized protein n=1 Tax=Colletotrichum higginsianum (strain IMI 349063) TaxID=759273 RepID=H1VV95_COLHI|nr:hypothetical protein CH063_13648 [Colletotrichum higginsianum]
MRLHTAVRERIFPSRPESRKKEKWFIRVSSLIASLFRVAIRFVLPRHPDTPEKEANLDHRQNAETPCIRNLKIRASSLGQRPRFLGRVRHTLRGGAASLPLESKDE